MDIRQEFDNSFKKFLFGRLDRDLQVDSRLYQTVSKVGPTGSNVEKSVFYKNLIRYCPSFAAILKASIEPEINYSDFVDSLEKIELRDAASLSDINELRHFYKVLISSHFKQKNRRSYGITPLALDLRVSKEIRLIDFLKSSIIYKDLSDPVSSFFYLKNKLKKKPKERDQKVKTFKEKLLQGIADYDAIDDSLGNQQLILYYSGNRIKAAPTATWSPILTNENLKDSSIERGSIIQPNIFSNELIDELEYYINSNALESVFQKFFEKYPEFLKIIGDYQTIHPHPILHEYTGKKDIPDFFLERFDNKFCDICELKRPDAKLVTKTSNNIIAFSRALELGIQQLQTYRDYFDDRTNREKFKSLYGLDVFRPRVILVIGRKNNFHTDIDRIRLEESRLKKHMTIKTYDEIVDSARVWKNRILKWT